MMKKILTAILLCAMMLQMAACSPSTDETPETTDPSYSTDTSTESESTAPAETEPVLEIPAEYQNLDGLDFNILTRGNTVKYIDSESTTGDMLNDAIFDRMELVKELLNVNIKTTGQGAWYQTDEMANLQVGECAYDLILGHCGSIYQYVAAGLAINLNDISTLNLDAPWWNQDMRTCLEINEKLYACGSSISAHPLLSTMGFFFSKPLFEDNNLEMPYQLVRDGKWTFDKFEEYTAIFRNDLNNDGAYDHTNDLIGASMNEWLGMIAIFYTTGYNTVTPDDEGYPRITVYNEDTVSIFERVFALGTTGHVLINQEPRADAFWQSRLAFKDMIIEEILQTGDRDMDFGIIPMPKYTEDVAEYYSIIEGGADTLFVPVTVETPEISGVVTEALTYYGDKMVIPAFYENAIKHRYLRDQDSVEMIEIMRAGQKYDLGYHNQAQFGGSLGVPGVDLMYNPDTTLTTLYERHKPSIEALIEASMEKYLGN